MRKFLAITTFFATAALIAASIALAATPPTNEAYVGNTAHGHYHVSVILSCTGKKCKTGTIATISIKAGSPSRPTTACPYGGYDLPTGHVKQGKFSAATEFVISGKDLKFTVSGTFTTATKLTGSVAGVKACGGTDTFSLTGHHLDQAPTIGITG